ncbi:MAG: hypothetical protein BWY09_01968 [Candidatus Hydrogenedentes bacterium ADurb.Bin179]|nr:MAG: hypothetical protein BWY09_01968 [Candidatus Hydrogenedentes bacterium ADurb.Bin179]
MDGSQHIMGMFDIGCPITHGFVYGIFQRARSGIYTGDLRTHKSHAEYIETLPFHIFRAHIHFTLEVEQRCGRRRGYAVLTSTRFRDDPGLIHAPGKQALAQGVVYLVGTSMGQVFPLKVYASAA